MVAVTSRAVKLIYMGRLDTDGRWALAAHDHPFHQLIVVQKGAMSARLRGKTYHARAGDLLFYRRGNSHAEASDPRRPAQICHFSFEAPHLGDLPVLIADRGVRIRQMTDWLYADRGEGGPEAEECRQALFETMLLEFRRLHVPARQPDLLSTTRACMLSRIAEPITLEELARNAGMSKYHFARTYRAAAGRTVMESLRELRLNFARHLILTTNLPLKDVAPRAGLGDQYQLCHLIRRYDGISPGKLRGRARGEGSRMDGAAET